MLPLDGVKVVEWTTAVAGPYGGMVFADFGAEVTRIDRAGPKPGVQSIAHDRNKRSIAINVRIEEGKEILWRLLRTADVFLENFAPGAADRLGFSYEAVSKVNPKIIYISLKGYGEGPYGTRPAYDPDIEAGTGIMAATSGPGRPPIRVPGAVIDETTGMWCVIAAMGSLMNREKTGKGEYINASMFEDAVSLQSKFIALYSLYGQLLNPLGSGSGAARYFETVNWWVYVGVQTDEEWNRFCDAFGVSAEDKARFATKAARDRDSERVEKIVAGIVSKMTSKDVLKKLVDAKIPGALVNTMVDIVEDPHVKATSDMVSLTPSPRAVRTSVAYPMLPIRCGYYSPAVAGWGGKPTPWEGEHTIKILSELGYGEEAITNLRKNRVVSPYLEEAR